VQAAFVTLILGRMHHRGAYRVLASVSGNKDDARASHLKYFVRSGPH